MKVRIGAVCRFISIFSFVAFLSHPAHADRNALWNIVTLKCARHFEKAEAPVPCEGIDITGGEDRGYVYLKDMVGVGQMLTLPIQRISGIEDPALLAPDAPNYFAAAWNARTNVAMHLRRTLPRE